MNITVYLGANEGNDPALKQAVQELDERLTLHDFRVVDGEKQKNLILSNVQRIDCKDGFVVLVDLFERETRVEGRLATIDLVGNTAVIVRD